MNTQYSILNDDLASLDNFSIYFDQNFVSNITVDTAPLDWSADAYQPDLNIPDDGFVDSYTFNDALTNGQALVGLTVSFDWSGLNQPGNQRFDIFDTDWNLIDTGQTQAVAQVSEPATGVLMAMGIVGLCLARRKRLTTTGSMS